MKFKALFIFSLIGVAVCAVGIIREISKPNEVNIPDPVLRRHLQLAVAKMAVWDFPSEADREAMRADLIGYSAQADARIEALAPSVKLYPDLLGIIEKLTIEHQENLDTTGLEHCVGLTELRLEYCGLVDIAFVRHMPHLTTLDLTGNAIWDISPLATFKQFAFLRLTENRIQSLEPLRRMNFFELDLNNNMVSDASPLEQSEIDQLYLGWNNLTDFPDVLNMGLTKLVVAENPLSKEACERLRRDEAYSLIENLISDCPTLAPEETAVEIYVEGNVYTTGSTYHIDKSCAQAAQSGAVGMMKADRAQAKGLTPCPDCAHRQLQ